jgi:hypothetical protein
MPVTIVGTALRFADGAFDNSDDGGNAPRFGSALPSRL